MCDCLVALPRPAEAPGPAGAPAQGSPAGCTVFAKNSDRPPDERQAIEWHPPRHERRTRCTYVEIDGLVGDTVGFCGSRPEWMWGLEHGVNEAGVAIGNEAVFTTLDPSGHPDALVGMDLVRLGLERSTSAAEAVAVIESLVDRHGQGGSGHDPAHGAPFPYWSSFLVADGEQAYVVETSGREVAVEPVGGPTRAISNRLSIPGFADRHINPDPGLAAIADPRLEASRAVLESGPFGVTEAKAHLRSHAGGEGGWTVCMHVDGFQATTASLVAELPGPGCRLRRPLARFSLGWPCRSVFVPLLVGHPLGEVPPHQRFAALRGEHRAALDELEASLEHDAAAAASADDPRWNAEAWRRVAELLDDLGAVP